MFERLPPELRSASSSSPVTRAMSSARASSRICLYSFSSFAERRVLIAAICASVGPSSRGFSIAPAVHDDVAVGVGLHRGGDVRHALHVREVDLLALVRGALGGELLLAKRLEGLLARVADGGRRRALAGLLLRRGRLVRGTPHLLRGHRGDDLLGPGVHELRQHQRHRRGLGDRGGRRLRRDLRGSGLRGRLGDRLGDRLRRDLGRGLRGRLGGGLGDRLRGSLRLGRGLRLLLLDGLLTGLCHADVALEAVAGMRRDAPSSAKKA
jgi:hypothetical protein